VLKKIKDDLLETLSFLFYERLLLNNREKYLFPNGRSHFGMDIGRQLSNRGGLFGYKDSSSIDMLKRLKSPGECTQ